jgi:hypothetical protein
MIRDLPLQRFELSIIEGQATLQTGNRANS